MGGGGNNNGGANNTSLRQMNRDGMDPHSMEEQKDILLGSNLENTPQSQIGQGNNPQIPTVLRHKFQQLRDPKKYAQMIYLTYNPIPKGNPTGQNANLVASTMKTMFADTTEISD